MDHTSLGAWEYILPPSALDQAQLLFHRAYIDSKFCPTPVYPPSDKIFTAFQATPPEKIKAVILGQDPYHSAHQAHGLSFSVLPGIPLPKSLQNIFKELQSDLGCSPPNHGCLEHWAQEGVFLLNTVLTVYEGQADSHKNWGWQEFTQAVLNQTRTLPQPISYILWGAKAQKAAEAANVLDSPRPRLCISSAHPSPLGAYRGFWGSKPFSKTNEFLIANGSDPIDWQIPNI